METQTAPASPPSAPPTTRRGLNLDRVVLLGRTSEEYRHYFALADADLRHRRILDVASGVSSFTAESTTRGLDVTALDPIYALEADEIAHRCRRDLEHVLDSIGGLEVYRWKFYQNPERLRGFRERASRLFLADYAGRRGSRYRAGSLPGLPFADGSFDVGLVSYFLFAYEEQFDYEFHRASILELLRVSRGEVRIYPTVTFEGERSSYLNQLENDPALADLEFNLVPTDFEFLVGSNNYLRVRRKL